jgi:hypothetical protein
MQDLLHMFTQYTDNRESERPPRGTAAVEIIQNMEDVGPLLEGVEHISNAVLTGNQTVIIYRSPRTGIT